MDLFVKSSKSKGARMEINEVVRFIKKDAIVILGIFILIVGISFPAVAKADLVVWCVGDSEKVKTAKDTITRAIIGLIIVMGAYAITNFITGRLVETAAGPIEVAPPANP